MNHADTNCKFISSVISYVAKSLVAVVQQRRGEAKILNGSKHENVLSS